MAHELVDLPSIVRAINSCLAEQLPSSSALAPSLVEAMRYSTLDGGKRLRPSFVCATGTALGAALEQTVVPAVSVEFIHCYSLIHDDLPALDNDDLRRGKPSCHVKFGEPLAILTGDALLTLAFSVLTTEGKFSAEQRTSMVRNLADAAGWRNMVGGQVLDTLGSESGCGGEQSSSLSELEATHRAKTASLFQASVRLGVISSGVVNPEDAVFRDLSRFGLLIGHAFQIMDDVIDETEPTQVIGKPAHSDRDEGRSTYVSLLGVDESIRRAQEMQQEAEGVLDQYELANSPLLELARMCVNRRS